MFCKDFIFIFNCSTWKNFIFLFIISNLKNKIIKEYILNFEHIMRKMKTRERSSRPYSAPVILFVSSHFNTTQWINLFIISTPIITYKDIDLYSIISCGLNNSFFQFFQ